MTNAAPQAIGFVSRYKLVTANAGGLIKNLTAHRIPDDKSHFREVFKLTLNPANAGIYFACDLARIEGLIGVAIEQSQDGAPRAAEQKIRQPVGCTHSENNCTQDENAVQVRNVAPRGIRVCRRYRSSLFISTFGQVVWQGSLELFFQRFAKIFH